MICEGSEGTFLVEMQRRPENDFDDRQAYYAANLITRQVKRKEMVYNVRKVYILCVAGYQRQHKKGTPKDKVLFRYDYIEKETQENYDGSRLSYFFLELSRSRKKEWDNLTENAHRWCYMFKKMHTFANETPLPSNLHGFEDIVEDAKLDGLTDEQRLNYNDAMLNQHQLLSTNLASLKIGEERGELKAMKKAARKMLAKGISVEVVAECTELSEGQVRALKRK